jgi:DNA-directed RNA polymerase alpha subunit
MRRVEELLEEIARNTATESKPVSFADLGLADPQVRALQKGGFATMADLRNASDEDLLAVTGVGQKTVDQIREALA